MIDLLKLAVRIHLLLSFSLIFTLFFLGIKNLGFRRFFRELKDENFWYVIVVFLTAPYQVVLIGIGQVGKKTAETINKIKKMTTESEGERMSNSEIYLTRDEIEHPYANLTVMVEDKRRKAEQKSKTLFTHITASPEVLAEKLVYWRTDMGNHPWCSMLFTDQSFRTEKEAIAVTVAKLKEVEK